MTTEQERRAADLDALEALGLLAGLHPCLTVGFDQPMVAAQAIFDAVLAERAELTRCATSSSASVQHLHRMYSEKAAECERLRAALRGVLEFQSAPKGPTIHDWGRWRRVADGTPGAKGHGT
jgi:cell division septum initiation protein DivIVA